MYKEYKQMGCMKVMGALDPGSLTRSQKKGALKEIHVIKEKWIRKLKREDVCRCMTPEIIHD